MMPSPADLAWMQAAALPILTGTCTISRKTEGSDGMGGQSDTWTTLATVACAIAPAMQADNEQIQELRLGLVSGWIIRLPVGTDVTILDRIVSGGITYEVNDIRAPRTSPVFTTCICSRVQ